MSRLFYAARRVNSLLSRFPKMRQRIDAICVEYHQIQENLNYNTESNGEGWLIRTLAKHGLLGTVFDVGANHGDWASLVLQANPAAAIHCFEICQPTFQKLSAHLSKNGNDRPKLFLNPFGLSDAPGKIQVNYCPNQDGQTTLFEVMEAQPVQTLNGRVVRGQDYCAERGMASLDFLKIDVEGAEHLVLQGFEDMLVPAKVPVVQFEYGLVNIHTKFLLRDFYALFENRGYRVGKLLPDSVRFRPYKLQDEDFFGPNYIAASPLIAEFLEAKTRK